MERGEVSHYMNLVPIPTPDSTRYEGEEHEHVDRLAWRAGHDFEVSVWYPGQVQLSFYADVWEAFEPMNTEEARKLAYALLAGALAAEKQEMDQRDCVCREDGDHPHCPVHPT
jgi:hypothetical protein